MKKFTLIALAALFVAATSFAGVKQSERPLSKERMAALAKGATPNAKKQPLGKALQKQHSLELQKGLHAVVAAHNHLTDKSRDLTAAKGGPRRAIGEAIIDTPAGEQIIYDRSGMAYVATMFGTTELIEVAGAVGDVVFGADNTVYIKNLVSQINTGTWVKGTISGSKITIELPQMAIDMADVYGYSLIYAKLAYDEDEDWYFQSEDQTLTLNYDAATGTISSEGALQTGDEIVGLIYDDDFTWSGYADFDFNFSKMTDEPLEAPAGLATETYSLTGEGYIGSLVEVGFEGSDIWVKGIVPSLPDNWVKGTIEGNKATFKSGQYIGADLASGYHQYLMAGTAEEEYYEDWDITFVTYSLSDDDITFTYDADTKSLSEGSLFFINGGKTQVNYLSVIDGGVIQPFTEVAATPETPEIIALEEGGWEFFSYGWGWGDIDFAIYPQDTEGNYILPEKLSYKLWVRVNGEEKPLTLSSYDYMNQEEPTMTEIPFGYNDGWDFYSSGVDNTVYYWVIGPEAYGVQAIYRGGGEERASEIAWAEVETLGAEIQPEAATPAYPDVDPADTGKQIDYGFYTGDEQLVATTNNSKPERYDVALKVAHPALVGSYIKSITFPLQENRGVSNVSAWISSQLRVEDGKNVPDLAEVAVEAKAGFITVELEKPYIIPEEGVYVGYSFTIDNVLRQGNQKPVVILPGEVDGGLYLHTSDGFLKWLDVAEGFGGSASIRITVSGSAIKGDAAVTADGSTLFVTTGEPITMPLTLTNYGANGINSVDIDYTFGTEKTTKHIDLGEPVKGFFGKQTEVVIDLPAVSERGNYELTVDVTKVNGQDNETAKSDNSYEIVALNTVPKHRAVLEEYTGFWCGWCPRGFVGLEKLAESYADDYVLLSYHNGDELEIMDSGLFPSDIPGFPDAWIDRKLEVDPYYGLVYGEKEMGVVDDLEARSKEFGLADINIASTLADDGQTVNVTADVTFPYDVNDGNFALEYVLVADGLSDPTWVQSNYYSGNDTAPADFADFINGSSGVTGLVYNDVVVATTLLDWNFEGELPEAITADQAVSSSYSFDLAEVLNTAGDPIVVDKSKLKVAVLLVNAETGEICNANKAQVADPVGISTTATARQNGINSCYDLSGRQLAQPKAGVNIIRTADGRVVKRVKRFAK